MLKGYYVPSGYRGWIGDQYILFPTVREYEEYVEECKEELNDE